MKKKQQKIQFPFYTVDSSSVTKLDLLVHFVNNQSFFVPSEDTSNFSGFEFVTLNVSFHTLSFSVYAVLSSDELGWFSLQLIQKGWQLFNRM